MGKQTELIIPHRTSTSDRAEVLATLLPSNWPQDVSLARITCCGSTPILIEVLQGFAGEQPVYAPPAAALWKSHAGKTVLTLLGVLASQPDGVVSQDMLAQALRPGRNTAILTTLEEEEDEEDRALKRPENLVSQLRRLLYPPALAHLSESDQRTLRNLLVSRVKASQDSGPAYQLAPLPLVWLDVEAMEAHARQAQVLEQFGGQSLDEWQAVAEIGFHGEFLPHEGYSDWTRWRRARVRELLWQSVDVQLKQISQWKNQEASEEASLCLLLARWQAVPANEDAFRPLAELLGKRERFLQAEECYAQLCAALAQEERAPHERTEKVMEFVRAKKIQRSPTKTHLARIQQSSTEGSNESRFSFARQGFFALPFSESPTSSFTLLQASSAPFPSEHSGKSIFSHSSPSLAEPLERLWHALEKPAQLNEPALLALETLVRDCWRFRPDIVGTISPQLLQLVLGHVQHVTAFLSGSLLPSTRMRLCALASELTQIAGWTLYEMRAFPQAQAYYEVALAAAREANNPLLEAVALARMSRIFKYCAQEQAILPTLQYARDLLSNQKNSPIYSWLCAEEALAYARDDQAYESQKLLEHVSHTFGVESQGDDPYWVGFEENVKAGFFGSCYTALQQFDQAEVWYREALAQISSASRINPNHRRSLLSINLATLLLQQEALDEACRLATEALSLINQSKSPLVLQHLVKFRGKLSPWSLQAVVVTFDGAFREAQMSLREGRQG